jgi:hypothetical protein
MCATLRALQRRAPTNPNQYIAAKRIGTKRTTMFATARPRIVFGSAFRAIGKQRFAVLVSVGGKIHNAAPSQHDSNF